MGKSRRPTEPVKFDENTRLVLEGDFPRECKVRLEKADGRVVFTDEDLLICGLRLEVDVERNVFAVRLDIEVDALHVNIKDPAVGMRVMFMGDEAPKGD